MQTLVKISSRQQLKHMSDFTGEEELRFSARLYLAAAKIERLRALLDSLDSLRGLAS